MIMSGVPENRGEKMRRRTPRNLRPFVEEVEHRAMLSAITDVMAGNSIGTARRALDAAAQAVTSQRSGVPSIAIPANQGPALLDGMINNQAIAPTGTLTNRELRREKFTAQFSGTYTVGAGRTSDERIQTFITGVGSASSLIHCDIQLLLVTPNSSASPIGGVSAIFDRNINSNTVLGLDEYAQQSPQTINRLGLPTFIPTVSLDPNVTSGTYDEGYAFGTMRIHYFPSAKHTPGVFSQGKVTVTIHALVYTANVSFVLRNANIDP